MQAISIRQPEAWLITQGYKDIENRSKATHKRGLVAVHASSKRMTREDWDWLRELCADNGLAVPAESEIHYGGVVGVVEIVDCVTEHNSSWFDGPYGYVLGGYAATEFLPCPGKLGWFEVDVKVIE